MNWLSQDWEHEAMKDEIYLIESRMQMEAEWQQWEERNKRLPAIIQVLIPTIKDEAKRNTRTIRGAHQTQL